MLSISGPGVAKLIIERVGRQLAQTALPIFLAAGATPGHHDLSIAVTAIAVSVAVTLLKAIAGVRAKATDPIGKQLVDRAAPAFAGTFLGFIPPDLGDMGSVDWSHVLWAAVGAGVIAIVAYYATPPSNVVAATTVPIEPTAPAQTIDGGLPGEAEVEVAEDRANW